MTLRFILGRAGSGKTYYCLSEMARLLQEEQAGPLLFVLPEQATFIHERMLACDFTPHGYAGGEVTSFKRLAWQAARQAGEKTKPLLSEAARVLLMSRFLRQRQPELRLFGASHPGPGLAAALAQLAEELLAYAVAPERLAQAAVDHQGALAAKLQDLALLYGDYAAALAAYDNPYAGLTYLTRAIAEEGFLCDATVFVDGYSSFTPRELAVLQALMTQATRLEIALALDPQEAGSPALGQDIFAACRHSRDQLAGIARQVGVTVEPAIICDGAQGRFAGNAELAHLERYCYPLSGGPPWPQKPASLRVIAAASPRAEVEAAGREIRRLVREEGLRYREISVIARDLAPYEELLPQVFGGLDIPYFADSAKPLLYHPLIELMRAALEIWAGEAHYRQIFRYFKTGLTPLTLAETDVLENYCLAHGVRHWQWREQTDWQYWRGDSRDNEEVAERLAAINRLRRCGATALLHFLQAAPSAQEPVQAKALLGAFQELLRELEVAQTLVAWQEEALAAGRAEEAALHRQALERLTDFLAEAGELLRGCLLPARQLLQLLDAGCMALTLSLIPPGLDQVLVASLERSRNPELRAAIILGANADVLPRKAAQPPLLNDRERGALAQAGIELAADTPARQMAEHYLAYIACTRSHDKLLITYALNAADGKELAPSPLIQRLQKLFPALLVERYAEPREPGELTGGAESLSALARQLREEREGTPKREFWRDVHHWYAADGRWRDSLARLNQGLCFSPHQGQLAEGNRRALYGDTLRSSVSRLEKFNACPFAYFAAYGLQLAPRPVYEITPRERGDILHQVLAELGSQLYGDGPCQQELTKAQASALVGQVVTGLSPGLLSGILTSTARYRYQAARLQETLANTLLLQQEQLRCGAFAPIAWELSFGSREGDLLPPLTVELTGGRKLEISGQIDRVDVARGPGAAYARVIDYKSGNLALLPADILQGLRLQLLVYLQIVLDNPGFFAADTLKAAGLYYLAVRDELASSPMPKAGEAGSPPGLKLSGLTVKDETAVRLADPQIHGHSQLIPVALGGKGFYANSPGLTTEELQQLLGRLQEILQQTAQRMADGQTDVLPQRTPTFDACAYCDYRAFCGFDGEIKRAGGSGGEQRGA